MGVLVGDLHEGRISSQKIRVLFISQETAALN